MLIFNAGSLLRCLVPAAVVAAAAAIFAGCSKVSDAPTHAYTVPHTLRIGDIEETTSLNPHLATSESLNNMSQLTMAYLVRYGADNRPIPELATDIPSKSNRLISRDGRRITWHLRRHVRWSDGAPFDADDVVFSTRVVDDVRNNEVSRDGYDLIARIDEPDKYTVVFHLTKPYSAFLPTFFGSAGANPCILPKHIFGRTTTINTAQYNSKPIGIGPFRYVKWERGDHVELERNPYYWRGTPKLEKIVYRFVPDRNTLLTQLQTGEIDMWPLVGLGFYERVAALKNVRTIHAPGSWYTHLDFNGARSLFQDKPVREALRYAVDRRTMRDKIQHGLGVLQEGSISPSSPLYTALPTIAFDVRKAGALLDADGWKRGVDGIRHKSGQRLTFTLAALSGLADTDQEIELLRSTWQQIGVGIAVQHYPSGLMFAPYQQGGIVLTGKFDMTTFAWQMTPDGDLSNTHGCKQMPPNGQNDLRYCNPKTEALLNRAKAAYDEPERKPIIAAAEKQIIADVPEIVLWIREDVFSYNSDLTGWKPNAATPFDNMLDVDI